MAVGELAMGWKVEIESIRCSQQLLLHVWLYLAVSRSEIDYL